MVCLYGDHGDDSVYHISMEVLVLMIVAFMEVIRLHIERLHELCARPRA